MYEAIALLAAFAMVYSAIAGRLERTWISGAIVFTPQNRMFTPERVEAVVDGQREASLDDSIDALVDAAVAWQESDRFDDDLSIVAMEVTGT